MIAFLETNAPIIILLAIFGADVFIVLFKPDFIKRMTLYSNWSIGPYSHRIRKPRSPSRIGFLCWGFPYLGAALCFILNQCKQTDKEQSLQVVLAGFVVAGIGVVYDLVRKVK